MLVEPAGPPSASSPPAHEHAEHLRAARASIATTAKWCVKAREALGERRRARHRLSPPPHGRRGRELLPEDAARARSTSSRSRSATRRRRPTRRCARMTDIPFAIGEEFASKWQFLPYIERGIHQFNRIDVCNVGGLTEAMKVAGWSEAHYVDLMPHNPLGPVCTAATVHFCGGGAPNFSWLETRATPGRDCISASTTPSSSRCSRGSKDAVLSGPGRAGPRRRGRRGAARRQSSSSGRRRICSAGTARSPTGNRPAETLRPIVVSASPTPFMTSAWAIASGWSPIMKAAALRC